MLQCLKRRWPSQSDDTPLSSHATPRCKPQHTQQHTTTAPLHHVTLSVCWPSLQVRKKRQDGHNSDAAGPAKDVNDTPVQWIRIDPHMAWLRLVTVSQPEIMWRGQLKGSPDIDGQLEALSALALLPKEGARLSLGAIDELQACIMKKKKQKVMSASAVGAPTAQLAIAHGCIGGAKQQDAFDFRVQAAAASALARWQTLHAPAASTPGSNETWEGLHRLIRAYKVQLLLRRRPRYCDAHSQLPFLPPPPGTLL